MGLMDDIDRTLKENNNAANDADAYIKKIKDLWKQKADEQAQREFEEIKKEILAEVRKQNKRNVFIKHQIDPYGTVYYDARNKADNEAYAKLFKGFNESIEKKFISNHIYDNLDTDEGSFIVTIGVMFLEAQEKLFYKGYYNIKLTTEGKQYLDKITQLCKKEGLKVYISYKTESSGLLYYDHAGSFMNHYSFNMGYINIQVSV